MPLVTLPRHRYIHESGKCDSGQAFYRFRDQDIMPATTFGKPLKDCRKSVNRQRRLSLRTSRV
jgi:hypothetical protein